MTTLLYLTDLYYQANERMYYEEDLFITSMLKPHFNLLIGHPHQVLSYADCADVLVFRNTGPVVYYKEYFDRFVGLVKEKELVTFNSFDGKADIRGKQYLLDLTREGYPVIPTAATVEETVPAEKYIVKLKNGADSIGMELLDKAGLLQANLTGKIIQPFVDFVYEVSFYFLNNVFQYALYAPDKSRRWQLEVFQPSAADLAFATAFIAWDNVLHGIVRIDACRLQNGSLLLVEIEDLNPFLSIDLLPEEKRQEFVNNLITALKKLPVAAGH